MAKPRRRGLWRPLQRLANRLARHHLAETWVPPSHAVMLVSYPRSGNTWVRFLLANLLASGDLPTYRNLNSYVPDIYESDLLRLSRLSGAHTIIKSHQPLSIHYRRVIYLVRDPRDVLLSYHRYHQKFTGRDVDLEDFGRHFMDGTIDSFGSWGVHAGGWLGARRDDPDFLLVRYEDLNRDPLVELRRITAFIEWSVEPATLRLAVSRTTPDALRLMETEREAATPQLLRSSRDVAFVQKATSGYWHDDLPTQLALAIGEKWGGLLDELGYPRDASERSE